MGAVASWVAPRWHTIGGDLGKVTAGGVAGRLGCRHVALALRQRGLRRRLPSKFLPALCALGRSADCSPYVEPLARPAPEPPRVTPRAPRARARGHQALKELVVDSRSGTPGSMCGAEAAPDRDARLVGMIRAADAHSVA